MFLKKSWRFYVLKYDSYSSRLINNEQIFGLNKMLLSTLMLFTAMASSCMQLDEALRVHCSTVEGLELYVKHNNVDVNHPAVVARRNELVTRLLITDSDSYKLLQCCCNTFDELSKLVVEHSLDWRDAAVLARQRDLQV